MPLLDVSDLTVTFHSPDGPVNAVNGISFSIDAGECLAVVGESGSGKTQAFLALMGVVAENAEVAGQALFAGYDLLTMTNRQRAKMRGNRLAFVMQDSLSALTPHLRIGEQLAEILEVHRGAGATDIDNTVLEVLDRVRIPDARNRVTNYPHELSGGMRQRVTIAMGLLCSPDILIADEPTTALDVTIQANIMEIFDELRRDLNLAIVLITHDLGVVAGHSDRVMVMYGGRIVESAPTTLFFSEAKHPYSNGLLQSMPRLNTPVDQLLVAVEGRPPDLMNLPTGCAFAPRCHRAQPKCDSAFPTLEKINADQSVACYYRNER